jgi:hypothetical protein
MTSEHEARLFVSDLDGTLLDGDAQLSGYSRSELTRLLAAGLPFTVATARSVAATRLILRDLPMVLPVINFMGALISDLRTGVHHVCHALPEQLSRMIVATAAESGVMPFLSTCEGSRDHLYYTKLSNSGMQWYAEDRRAARDPRLQAVAEFAAHLAETVVCLTFIDTDARVADLAQRLQSAFGGSVQLAAWRHEYTGWSWLMVLDREATKAHALRGLAGALSVPLDNVTVFGDSVNDLPMFVTAGRSVAVANADEAVRQAADEIIGPNTSDSVVRYLREAWDESL